MDPGLRRDDEVEASKDFACLVAMVSAAHITIDKFSVGVPS
jgi:hypothetical protein